MFLVTPNQPNLVIIKSTFKILSIGLCLFICLNNYGQNEYDTSPFFFTPELLVGKTLEANTDFPETGVQKNMFLSFGRYNFNPNKEWAARLNYPKTGLSIGYTDFGNSENVGYAYSLIPFMEFPVFKSALSGLNLQIGIGASYMDTQFNEETNPFNRAITTKINWSFRSFLYYALIFSKRRFTDVA